jgi:hypothetical protein
MSSQTYSSQPGSSTTGGILGGGTAGTSSSGATSGGMPKSTWGGQPQQQSHQGFGGIFSSAREWMQYSIENSSDFMRRYVNQYPVLAAYLFTLMAFSAVPVSIYTILSSSALPWLVSQP